MCDATYVQAAERGSTLKRSGREEGPAWEHRGLKWREGKDVESRVGED